jgi:gluconokinase
VTGSAAPSALRIVVMGPSGSGKSVVGAILAERCGVGFIDADDLHPEANVAKMMSAVPLDDEDRMPWLDVVATTLHDAAGGAVIACSALARRYRDRIRAGAPDALFVELRVPAGELARRMSAREHFMPTALLQSQLASLEELEPDEPGFVIANDRPPAEIAEDVRAALSQRGLVAERQSLR